MAELTRVTMKELLKNLGYDTSSAVECLLIDHIALAWVNYHFVLFKYDAVTNGDGVTLSLGLYWEKRLSVAQGRYSRALEMLAKVRKMALSLIQVSINQR